MHQKKVQDTGTHSTTRTSFANIGVICMIVMRAVFVRGVTVTTCTVIIVFKVLVVVAVYVNRAIRVRTRNITMTIKVAVIM